MAAWRTMFSPQSVSDWPATLCTTANGRAQHDNYGDWTGTIDDTADAIRLAATGPQGSATSLKRTRTELSMPTSAAVPSETLYEWDVLIPGWVDLRGMERLGGGITTIAQFHADQACYGGGMWLDPLTDDLYHRVKGGPTLSSRSSCVHEYDHSIKVGKLTRDEWNHIRVEVRWSTEADGYALSMVMGRESEPNSCAAVHDVPTQGGGGSGLKPASKVMWRLGWYPPFVPREGLEMLVRNAKVSTR